MPGIVTVEGPDAGSYLQGQISQDVSALPVGASAWTFVLEPNGKIVALAEITRTGDDRFELTTDAGWGAPVHARLERFKLRVRVDLSLREERDGEGVDAWGRDAADRVRDGWPAMGAEIEAGVTTPAETGIADVAVSFTKGCYTGQELVERMDARQAAPPRRVVHVASQWPLGAPGAVLAQDGVEVGRVTTVAGSAGSAGSAGLAVVARSVVDGAVLDGAITVTRAR